MNSASNDEIRNHVRERYSDIAAGKIPAVSASSCCGSAAAVTAEEVTVALGYSRDELAALPEGVVMGLGCGNPQAIAELKPGETVLDLGSGGGIDCFLAAKSVGPEGRAIGVDMTPEMVTKARENVEKTGISNVEFRLGEMEHLPVADESIDVIMSNCVINLSPEKERVFAEAYRVLKPGGRIAVSDVVAIAELPDVIKQNLALYAGCISGASMVQDLELMMREAGFTDIRINTKPESKDFILKWAPGTRIEDFIASATIEAVK